MATKQPLRSVQEDAQRRAALKQALELAPFSKAAFARYCGVSASYIYLLTGDSIFATSTGVSDRMWAAAQRYLGEWLEMPGQSDDAR